MSTLHPEIFRSMSFDKDPISAPLECDVNASVVNVELPYFFETSHPLHHLNCEADGV